MQKSCYVTFTSCYTRNGNLKDKPKTSEKWVTVTSRGDLFNHGIDVDYKQMGCSKILSNQIYLKILASVISEIKRSMQATTCI